MFFGSIPPPPVRAFHLGPFDIHVYGIILALAIAAGLFVAYRRAQARGGHGSQVLDLAIWAIPGGIIGARLYHVITDWHLYEGIYFRIFFLWDGGLSIWGAISGGAFAVWLATRKARRVGKAEPGGSGGSKGLSFTEVADVAAPALLLAQAIGRFGNYFNQEIFGRPTSLPWAVEIEPLFRPFGYFAETTYHPTFLYESLWCFGAFVLLLVWEKAWRGPEGSLLARYVLIYCTGRLLVELFRIDPTPHLLGMRLHLWGSGLGILLSLAWLVISRQRWEKRTISTTETDR